MSFNNAATILYAVDNTSRQLGTIDQATGAFTSIGPLNPDPGTAFTVLGLTFDPTAGGQGYITLSNGATGTLFRIDVSNAALTAVGNLTHPVRHRPRVRHFPARCGRMDIVADVLLRVDKDTGAPTVVGPTGMQANFAQGMMYDSTDNTLYGCAFVTAPAQQGQLVTFNQATGAATIVAGPVPDEMECSVKRAVGPCTGPSFGGLISAVSAGTTNCAVNLTWNAGTPCGATTLKYNVYRSTSSEHAAVRGDAHRELPDHAHVPGHHRHRRHALLLQGARRGQPDDRHRPLQQRPYRLQQHGAQRRSRRPVDHHHG